MKVIWKLCLERVNLCSELYGTKTGDRLYEMSRKESDLSE